jgi:hypothetical protein
MRKNHLFSLGVFVIFSSSLIAQENTAKKTDGLIPYAGFFYGGCDVSIPFSFVAGIQQPLKKHLSISYDVHYWNSDYECYCDDTYSKGHFVSMTPSVKFIYNTGKKTGNGFFTGVGIGYMIATDKGTEQPYIRDNLTNTMVTGKDIVNGRWNFNSIAPSMIFGVGFRIFHLPVAINNTYYFAKTTDGWGAVTGGIGLKVGLRKLQ